MKIISYNDFCKNDKSEGLIAGTLMSIQEKKSAKGTQYAILKLSDLEGEFELFLFSDILISNREILKESESFVLTLFQDKVAGSGTNKRLSVKKISSIEGLIKRPYSKVTIELNDDCKINEVKQILCQNGETKIDIIVNNNNKKAHYSLQNNRKFDLQDLKALKAKKYIAKISV